MSVFVEWLKTEYIILFSLVMPLKIYLPVYSAFLFNSFSSLNTFVCYPYYLLSLCTVYSMFPFSKIQKINTLFYVWYAAWTFTTFDALWLIPCIDPRLCSFLSFLYSKLYNTHLLPFIVLRVLITTANLLLWDAGNWKHTKILIGYYDVIVWIGDYVWAVTILRVYEELAKR